MILIMCQYKAVYNPMYPPISSCVSGRRILQYGQMSMARDGNERVTKAHIEAAGDQGLLNLLTEDTVFYVGGYPSTFKVSA